MNFRWSILAASALIAVAAGASAQDYPWKPTRPVTVIVPWAAGGSTDQMARIVANELEAELKQKFVVVNQPGASGSIGTKSALDAAHDGYTWAAGAAVDVGSYKVLGLLDTNLADWALYYAIANVTVTAENPNAPYKDFGELLTALKTRGSSVAVATAGLSSAGHNMMEMIKAATGITYKHVTYDGGNPAVIAAVSGETPVVTQLLVEMSEHIKAKRLKPLAALNDKPVMLEGYGEIPAITQWVPNMKPAVNYFGIWVPKNAPAEVIKTMEMVWQNKIAKSDVLKKYADSRSAIFAPLYGQQAFDGGMKMVQPTVWMYFDAGKAKVSPDAIGIARP